MSPISLISGVCEPAALELLRLLFSCCLSLGMDLPGSFYLKLVFLSWIKKKQHTLFDVIKNPHCSPREQLWPREQWHWRQQVSALPLFTVLKTHLNWAKQPAPEKSQWGLVGV